MGPDFSRKLRLLVLSVTVLSVGTFPAPAQTTDAPDIVQAAKQDDIATVENLIAAGVDINATQGDGATALHWAAHRNNLESVRLLLNAGADPNKANALQATALWIASENGNATLTELLLNAGANPNAALKMGETPLMRAARSGDLASVKLLVSGGAEVNVAEHERGQTALMWASAQQHADVVEYLLDHGADLNARTKVWHQLENTAGNTNPIGNFKMAHGGTTALLFVARNGDVESARALLDAGADVNATAAAGTSALVVAAHSGHEQLALLLLERGADPNAAEAGYTALHAATLRSLPALVDDLLERGVNVNASVQHGTPGRRFSADYSIRYQTIGVNALWLAARYGEAEIALTLAEHGADPFVLPENGTSALKAAVGLPSGNENRRNRGLGYGELDREAEEKLSLNLVNIVLDLGVDVNLADGRGNTPLHDAVRMQFESVVELLATHGADVNAANERGETPLDLAETNLGIPGTNGLRTTRPRIAELLRELGAAND